VWFNAVPQGDFLSDVGAGLGGLVQQAQQGAQQLGDALKAGKIVSDAYEKDHVLPFAACGLSIVICCVNCKLPSW
jgi:hypothetical protein